MVNAHFQPKIGLALGAGAARGLAHLGVLTALEENGIPIDLVTGTSFGALVAANYACTPNARLVRDNIVSFARSRSFRRNKFDFIRDASLANTGVLNTLAAWAKKAIMFSSTLTRNGFISSEAMAHNIACCLPDTCIEETPIPFCAVAADVHSGEELLITRGPIRLAVHASCAIAGVFPPVAVADRLLTDGGCVDKVPVLPALKMGAEFVIAVDVCNDLSSEEPRTGADLVWRTAVIEGVALKKMQLCLADVVINPGVGGVHWADFRRPEELARLGEEAVLAALPEIRSRLEAASAARQAGQVTPSRLRAEPFLQGEAIQFYEIPAANLTPPEEQEKPVPCGLRDLPTGALAS